MRDPYEMPEVELPNAEEMMIRLGRVFDTPNILRIVFRFFAPHAEASVRGPGLVLVIHEIARQLTEGDPESYARFMQLTGRIVDALLDDEEAKREAHEFLAESVALLNEMFNIELPIVATLEGTVHDFN